jgi:hypothetical protein
MIIVKTEIAFLAIFITDLDHKLYHLKTKQKGEMKAEFSYLSSIHHFSHHFVTFEQQFVIKQQFVITQLHHTLVSNLQTDSNFEVIKHKLHSLEQFIFFSLIRPIAQILICIICHVPVWG